MRKMAFTTLLVLMAGYEGSASAADLKDLYIRCAAGEKFADSTEAPCPSQTSDGWGCTCKVRYVESAMAATGQPRSGLLQGPW